MDLKMEPGPNVRGSVALTSVALSDSDEMHTVGRAQYPGAGAGTHSTEGAQYASPYGAAQLSGANAYTSQPAFLGQGQNSPPSYPPSNAARQPLLSGQYAQPQRSVAPQFTLQPAQSASPAQSFQQVKPQTAYPGAPQAAAQVQQSPGSAYAAPTSYIAPQAMQKSLKSRFPTQPAPQGSRLEQAQRRGSEIDQLPVMEVDKDEAPIKDKETLRNCFAHIDLDRNGTISCLEWTHCIRDNTAVCSFLLPGIDGSKCMTSDETFEKVSQAFDETSHGKQRVDLEHFLQHFREVEEAKNEATKQLRSLFTRLAARIRILAPSYTFSTQCARQKTRRFHSPWLRDQRHFQKLRAFRARCLHF